MTMNVLPGLGPYQPYCIEEGLVSLSPDQQYWHHQTMKAHSLARGWSFILSIPTYFLPVDDLGGRWVLKNIPGVVPGRLNPPRRWTREPRIGSDWVWLEWVVLLNAVAMKVFEFWRSACSEMTHLVIVLWPNASEALAATKIIDCHMIAFVPCDDIIQIKNSVFFRIDSITCYSNHMFSYVFTFQY